MPTTNFTATQAAQQIARTVLEQLPGWVPSAGSPLTLTYAFRASAVPSDFPLPSDQMSGFTRSTSSEIAAANLALQLWSDVANIRLNRVGSGDSGEGAFTNNAELLLGNWTTGAATSYASGWGTYSWFRTSGGVTTRSANVWIDGTEQANLNPSATNGGSHLFVHEIGHALGLSHPGAYNVGPGTTLTYAANAEYVQDSLQYTVMSYFDETNTGANYGGLKPTTPMLHDIAALQAIYGANSATRSGDTTYGFHSNADRSVFQLTSAADKPVFTIWDGGGTNTLDLSGFAVAQNISLLPGTFSDVNGLKGDVAIAFGTTIHNAVGGAGRDVIVGNDANNTITGGAGNDTIDGGAGTNAAVYTGASRGYTLKFAAGSTSLSVQDKIGSDGLDTLANIQQLKFADQTIDASTYLKASSLAAAQLGSLTELYIASFNRAPDALGLDYWASRLKDGMLLQDIAKSFFVQPEAAAYYPAQQTTEAFVTAVYGNVLNRGPDAGGLAYWSAELQSGHVSKDSFLLAIINGAHANTGAGTDTQVLSNKQTAGEHFALAQGLNNGDWAKSIMAGVGSTTASVAAANTATDAFAQMANAASTSELVVQIVGIAT